MPQAIQRVDSAHFAWVSCVPVAFLPIAITEVLRGVEARACTIRARTSWRAASVAALPGLVLPYFTVRTYTDYSLQSFGYHRIAYKIEHKGRIFYYGRPDAATPPTSCCPWSDRISKPGDRLFVGPDRPAQDAVQRRVPLLHAARPRPGDVLHRDGPRRGQRARARGWPTTCAPPTSRSCRRSGTTGTSRTTPASSARTEPNRDPEAGLLSRRSRSGAAVSTSSTGAATSSHVSCRTCARSSSSRPTSKRRTSTSSSGAHAPRSRARTFSSSTTTAPTAPPTSPRRPPPSSGGIDVLRRPAKQGLGSAYRAGFAIGLDKGYDVLVQIDADLSHDPAVLPNLLAARSSAAPTSPSARGTCPGARSRTGRGSGGRCRATATATPPSCSGRESRTPRPGTASTAPTRSKAIDYATTRAKGYGFQIETAVPRAWRGAAASPRSPIVFTDRVRGYSKMTWGIFAEELLLVTWWGIRDRARRLWRRRRPG